MPDLAELIMSVKDAHGYSYQDLETRGGGVFTRQRWGQLGKGTRIVEFPEPATIAAIAEALDVTVNRVVLAVAKTVGLLVRQDVSDLAAMLPESAQHLSPEQRDAILAVVKVMNTAEGVSHEETQESRKEARGTSKQHKAPIGAHDDLGPDLLEHIIGLGGDERDVDDTSRIVTDESGDDHARDETVGESGDGAGSANGGR